MVVVREMAAKIWATISWGGTSSSFFSKTFAASAGMTSIFPDGFGSAEGGSDMKIFSGERVTGQETT
jgi:hypothetical protein